MYQRCIYEISSVAKSRLEAHLLGPGSVMVKAIHKRFLAKPKLGNKLPVVHPQRVLDKDVVVLGQNEIMEEPATPLSCL